MPIVYHVARAQLGTEIYIIREKYSMGNDFMIVPCTVCEAFERNYIFRIGLPPSINCVVAVWTDVNTKRTKSSTAAGKLHRRRFHLSLGYEYTKIGHCLLLVLE